MEEKIVEKDTNKSDDGSKAYWLLPILFVVLAAIAILVQIKHGTGEISQPNKQPLIKVDRPISPPPKSKVHTSGLPSEPKRREQAKQKSQLSREQPKPKRMQVNGGPIVPYDPKKMNEKICKDGKCSNSVRFYYN